MPFVPVPTAALVELRMTYDDQQVENTLWFKRPGGFDAGTLLSLNNQLTGWWVDFYSPLVSEALQLREVVCTDMSSATGPQVSLAPAVAAFGGDGSPALPH